MRTFGNQSLYFYKTNLFTWLQTFRLRWLPSWLGGYKTHVDAP